jgi:hypothetical protein
MESLMWDMAQADQYAALYLAKDSAHIYRKTETLRLYEQVFRLHQVSREEFSKSYQYYLKHPKLNQLLSDSVIMRGVRARSEDYDRPYPAHPPAVNAPSTQGVAGPKGVTPGMPGGAAFTRSRDSAFRARQTLRARDSAVRAVHPPVKNDTFRKHSESYFY